MKLLRLLSIVSRRRWPDWADKGPSVGVPPPKKKVAPVVTPPESVCRDWRRWLNTIAATSIATMMASDSVCVHVEPVRDRHLDPDEDQDAAERVREVVETFLGVGEQEVHRPQTEDREGVRGEDEIRLVRDRQDRRHRVDGEDDVGDLDHEQGGQQRCRGTLAVDPGEELLPVELVGHRHDLAQQAKPTSRLLLVLVVAVADDLQAGVDEEDAEHQQQPPEPADQRAAEDDEDRPQGEGTEDAPEQHPMLILQRDRQRGEQHRPHEDVVDAERLLDQVATDELTERTAAERDRDHAGERETAHHPDQRLDGRFLGCRRMRFAVAEQVDRQHDDDHGEQRDPRCRGNVDVDEVGTIASSNEVQRKTPFDCLEYTRTVEGLAPAGCGRGAGQQAAVLTTDPEGYSPSTRTVCPADPPQDNTACDER